MKFSIKLKMLCFVATVTTHSSFANAATQKELSGESKSLPSINSAEQRFIPVELFTGAKWDGKHQLNLKMVKTTACAKSHGTTRPCDKYLIFGPFKTKKNETKIEWAGEEIPYYLRTFSTRRMGKVESFFTINNSRDGLVRIYDKRKQWGERTYDGLGSKFPLGYWKQGEVRTYPSKRPTRIQILELNAPDNCLTFRWTVGEGKKRNQDNVYTFCPNKGFTNFRYYNYDSFSKNR